MTRMTSGTMESKRRNPSGVPTTSMRFGTIAVSVLLLLSLIAPGCDAWDRKKHQEQREKRKEEIEKFEKMKLEGADQVSMTSDAAALRNYELRKKKRKGILRKREASLSQVLFPGASPEEYDEGTVVPLNVEQVESRKTQIPFKFYDLPVCKASESARFNKFRKNLGSRLQGHKANPSPYDVKAKHNVPCKPICKVTIENDKLRWMRKIVERQYRIHLSLDQLPVLMKNKQLNYAVRGYPVGFKAQSTESQLQGAEMYLYNHLKFTINYLEDDEFEGIRITGFAVHPVSIAHKIPDEKEQDMTVETCNGENAGDVINNPSTYLALRSGPAGEPLQVIYSYEVEWEESEVPWADRWDVYLIGAPDDDIHYFAIVNSLMIALFLMGAVATIMVRTLRKDIAGYNEMQTLEEAQEETGWKLVHGDVFRPPSFSPMILSVMVGTGAQIGVSFAVTLLCAIMGMLNPLKKGQTLTSIIVLYVLCGSVAGYSSARLYKFCDGKAWKRNTLMVATAFPGLLVAMFTVLNVFLSFVGSATAVSIWTIIALFLLWVCVSAPLVFVGSYFGFRAAKTEVPTKTNQIARFIPEQNFFTTLPWCALIAGVLPFGSVCIELFFIMSALWLHQIYYVMGFLLAVLVILAATCSMVSIVSCYLQLCGEDHRWWWKSFYNCASAGFYLFLYSLWFLSSKLDLVGVLPVMVYLTYMSMISMAFSMFCGMVGLYSCFWFTRKIYGAVKVD